MTHDMGQTHKERDGFETVGNIYLKYFNQANNYFDYAY